MAPIDIIAIEQKARQLRAEEMHRLESIVGEYVRVYALVLGEILPSLLKAFGQAVLAKLRTCVNHVAHRLCAWNPHRHHPAL